MKRLILTSTDSGAGALAGLRPADRVVGFGLDFVWGQLPSEIEIGAMLSSSPPMRQSQVSQWRDFVTQGFDEIELWVDPDPNGQLTLIWFLDYVRHHAENLSNLTLVQADLPIGNHTPKELAGWRSPRVKILNDHFETASKAWRADRQPTPQDWFKLLGEDLSVLPQLRHAVLELLEGTSHCLYRAGCDRDADAGVDIGR